MSNIPLARKMLYAAAKFIRNEGLRQEAAYINRIIAKYMWRANLGKAYGKRRRHK